MSDDRQQKLDARAALFEAAAEELEKAAAHARTSAQHLRDGEIPRAGAHAWATRGHVLAAEQSLDEDSLEHRLRSRPEPRV
jgi:hypothetical protein